MYHIRYRQETLKDIVENTAKEEELQQQTKEEEEQEAVIELTKEGTRVKKITITGSMNRDNTKIDIQSGDS